MPKGRFKGRRFSANKAQTLWVTDVNTQLLGPTSELSAFTICAGSNWERSNNSGETATVIGIKGYLSVFVSDTTISDGDTRFSCMLSVQDEDAPAPAALGASVIDAEQSMWNYHTGFHCTGINESVFTGPIANAIAVDVKTKRKITNGQGVDFAIRYEALTGTGNIIRVQWMLRTLIKIV